MFDFEIKMIDIGYAVRLLSLVWRRKMQKKNENILVETVIRSRCWPNDLDFNLHMNNARYLREADFGRLSLLMETGLWDCLGKRRKSGIKDANVIVSGLQIQYRQSLKLGDRFNIRSRINGWDEKAFYIEQSIDLEKSNEIACLFLVRLALIPRSLTPQMLVNDLHNGFIQSPLLSQSMKRFQENYRITISPIKSKI